MCLGNKLHLIPKPSGGDRPIGLIPFIMKLFFRMQRPGARHGTTENHGAWDTAIPGSSAPQAALKRAFAIECAKIEGEAFALVLLDIEKLYANATSIAKDVTEKLFGGRWSQWRDNVLAGDEKKRWRW